MDQQSLEQRIAQLFGSDTSRVAHGQATKEIDNPAFVPPGTPGFNPTIQPKLSVTEETWKNADGTELTIQRWPDGSIHEIGAVTAPAKQPTTRTPEQQTVDAAAAAKAAQDQKEREFNNSLPPDQDPAYETNAERRARAERVAAQQRIDANTAADNARADAARAQSVAQANRPSVTLTDDGKGGKIAVITTPDGKVSSQPVPGVQGTPPTVTVNGVVYERQQDGTYAPAKGLPGKPNEILQGRGTNGEDVQVIRDPKTGEVIRYEPIPGSVNTPSQNAGPPLPTIILGQSQDALRAYSQQLYAEVAAGRMTSAERERRWNEAFQMATQTYNEAVLQQRENEANLNASTNLANSRLQASTSGFNTALDFVSKINGTLPENSDLGGKAFVALLGLQVMQAQKMGAYDNIKPGSQPSVFGRTDAAPPSATAPSSAVESATPPPASAVPAPATPSQTAAAPATPPPSAANPPSGDAQTPNPPSPMSDTQANPAPPDGSFARQDATGSVMVYTPDGRILDPTQGYAAIGTWDQKTPPTGTAVPMPTSQPVNPAAGEPGHNPNQPVGQAPSDGEDFAVLAQARQNPPAGVTPMAVQPSSIALNPVPRSGPPRDIVDYAPGSPQMTPANTPQTSYPPSIMGPDMDVPPAALHTQARALPPWRISPQQYQQMVAAGVAPETIMSVPGAA